MAGSGTRFVEWARCPLCLNILGAIEIHPSLGPLWVRKAKRDRHDDRSQIDRTLLSGKLDSTCPCGGVWQGPVARGETPELRLAHEAIELRRSVARLEKLLEGKAS